MAFWELGTERQLVGTMMGAIPGPIPVRAIDYMAEREGMGPTDTIIFRRLMRAMDSAYMTAKAAKQVRDQASK